MILTKKGAKLSDTKKYTVLEKSIDDVSARIDQQAALLKEVLLMMANDHWDKVTDLQNKVDSMRGRISDISDDIHEIRIKLEND